jgi:hypothetical protein
VEGVGKGMAGVEGGGGRSGRRGGGWGREEGVAAWGEWMRGGARVSV